MLDAKRYPSPVGVKFILLVMMSLSSFAPGPLVLGALASQVGIPLVFQITSAVAFVALLLAWALLGRRPSRAGSSP